jgi:hypothetical protein
MASPWITRNRGFVRTPRTGVHARALHVRLATGRVTSSWIATVTDITERKRVEDDLRRTAALSRRRIGRSARPKGPGHGLPRNCARLSTPCLAGRDAAEGHVRGAPYLLDVSRIVSGRMQVTRSSIDLYGVVRGALEIVQPSAKRRASICTWTSMRRLAASMGRRAFTADPVESPDECREIYAGIG